MPQTCSNTYDSNGNFIKTCLAQVRFSRALRKDTTLSLAARNVIELLADWYNNKYGYAWPSVNRIAEELNIRFQTVFKSLKLLEERGWVTIIHGRGGFGNRYIPAFERGISNDNGPESECIDDNMNINNKVPKAHNTARSIAGVHSPLSTPTKRPSFDDEPSASVHNEPAHSPNAETIALTIHKNYIDNDYNVTSCNCTFNSFRIKTTLHDVTARASRAKPSCSSISDSSKEKSTDHNNEPNRDISDSIAGPLPIKENSNKPIHLRECKSDSVNRVYTMPKRRCARASVTRKQEDDFHSCNMRTFSSAPRPPGPPAPRAQAREYLANASFS